MVSLNASTSRFTRRALIGLALPATLVLAACGGQSAATTSTSTSGSAAASGISVVASTNVYGDIAKQIGGDKIQVTSIINRESQDPHSYEASAQDRLAVSKAQLVIANGGGYDTYMDQLTSGGSAPIIHAFDFKEGGGTAHDHSAESSSVAASSSADPHAGHDHSGDGNEHVWYDLHTVEAVADGIKDALVKADAANASTYEANTKTFVDSLAPLTDRTHALADKNKGKTFAMTEPVPYYLLTETGFTDATPAGFSSAIEAGNDVPALVQLEMEKELKAKSFAFLAFNPQTATPQTDAIKKVAQDSGVPVLDFLELLPEGKTFQQWMGENISSIEGVNAK